MLFVTFQVSPVACHLSPVTCHMSITVRLSSLTNRHQEFPCIDRRQQANFHHPCEVWEAELSSSGRNNGESLVPEHRAGVVYPVPRDPRHLQGLPVATGLFMHLSIVSFFLLIKRVCHLQGLPVAAGLFKYLSIVNFFQFHQLFTQASRLAIQVPLSRLSHFDSPFPVLFR